MAKLGVRNKDRVLRELELRITRMRDIPDELYREVVGKVFRRILRQTPQFSGAAVAHWTIGLGSPNTFYDPGLGRSDLRLARSAAGETRPLARGNRYWIDVAWRREKPKIEQIKKGRAVYITNGVLGDTDNGRSLESYITSLQDPSYAAAKLRPENQVYEPVQDSVAWVVAQYRNKKLDLLRYSFSLPENDL